MTKTKTLKATNNVVNDVTIRDTHTVNIRFNKDCIMTLALDMSAKTLTGYVKGESVTYTINAELVEGE